MFLHVDKASYIGEYRVWLEFNDGSAGEVDLSNNLEGKIFEPLKDREFFGSFALRGHTLSWDNGADFAPEFLQELLLSQGKVASRV
ncbi:hypothetical protein BH24DEI2_BH24DEI2_15500 [soil metagenome]